MYTRREFGHVVVGGFLLPALANAQPVGGVRLGVQTYSFRGLPRSGDDLTDSIVDAMVTTGLREAELWAPQIEPSLPGATGRGATSTPDAQHAQRTRQQEELRRWRLETPLRHFQGIREKFERAGLSIYAFMPNFPNTITDEEIDRYFEMGKALGATILTATTTLDVAPRIAKFAGKHRMIVGIHGSSNVSAPNEFATPQSFVKAISMSPFLKLNFDIAHFTAANYDAVAFIREHHRNITTLHLSDRKKNQGPSMPWGQGDTPIREVLQLLKREQWPIRVYLEYAHRGEGSPAEEVAKCFAYAKDALA